MRQPALHLPSAILALFCLPAFAGECRSLDPLAWLLGEWVADNEKSTIRESWTARSPRTWEGIGSETPKAAPSNSSSEDLRLVAMADGVFYVAKVAHNPLPVAIRLSECEDGRLAFVNPGHDFPKRIEYVRQGGEMLAVTVGDGAGDGFTLNFARVVAPAADPDGVLAAEDARFAAMVAAEPEAMRRWLAEDLVYVHSTGKVDDREQLIEGVVGGRLRYLAIVPSERQVSFGGADTAIVRGIARIHARAGDQAVDFPARYLAVYARVDGTWRLRAWQSLRLP
ncbi:MAG: nuclear transport factor 2 family protein [Gammaproteobacteria bacterium]|nr:nuclear transport factor 2 family protein [Gammaproteobacteria bacterium]